MRDESEALSKASVTSRSLPSTTLPLL